MVVWWLGHKAVNGRRGREVKQVSRPSSYMERTAHEGQQKRDLVYR